MLNKHLNKLARQLDRQYDFLAAYLHILATLTRQVAAVNVEGVQNHSMMLAELTQKNKELEQSHAACLLQLALQIKIPVETITLSKIISTVNAFWAKELEKRKQKLLEIIFQIQVESKTNSFLLNYALNFTHQIVNINHKGLNSDQVYSQNGLKKERIDQRKIVDQRI